MEDVTAHLDAWRGKIKADVAQARVKLAALEKDRPADEINRSDYYFHHSINLLKLGRYKDAITDARKARDILWSQPEGGMINKIDRIIKWIYSIVIEALGGDYGGFLEQAEVSAKKYGKGHSGNRMARASLYGFLTAAYAEAGNLEGAKDARLKSLRDDKYLGDLSMPGWLERYRTLWKVALKTGEGRMARETGRYQEAERHFLLAQALIRGEDFGDFELMMKTMNVWIYQLRIDVLLQQGRLVEAELMARRAIEFANKDVGGHIGSMSLILELGETYYQQGRYGATDLLARRVLAVFKETDIEKGSQRLIQARSLLARSLFASDRYDESLQAYKAIWKDAETNKGIAGIVRRFGIEGALLLAIAGDANESLTRVQPMIKQLQGALGPDHVQTLEARAVQAAALARTGRKQEALQQFAGIMPKLIGQSASTGQQGSGTAASKRLRHLLEAYLALLADAQAGRLQAPGIDPAGEGFRLVSAVQGRSVQQSLVASVARGASGGDQLGNLVRQRQDSQKRLATLFVTLNKSTGADAQAGSAKNTQVLEQLIAAEQTKFGQFNELITQQFPQFEAITKPRLTTVADVQRHLAADEAAVVTFSGRQRLFVWAVPKSGRAQFHGAALGSKGLSATVTELRKALDPQIAQLSDIPAYDLDRAHKLYQSVLAPVKEGWNGAKSLIVVADGALGFLPLSILPTGPAQAGKGGLIFTGYRDVPWLARSHAVTVVPSAAAFVSLRSLPAGQRPAKAMIGFGDPIFSKRQSRVASSRGVQGFSLRSVRSSAAGNLDGGKIRSSKLGMLARLPETADELRSIAGSLGADPRTSLFLDKAATEERVKSMNLLDRRIVVFSTHALVPGDLDGLLEPAIALSSPDVVGGKDDGLLTMNEVMKLKLNADLVVLSACNTAAANGGGAEALSGLGSAFFYAGSRSLLASHWPVFSDSTKQLVSDIFSRVRENAGTGRGRILQKAMLALIEKGTFKQKAGGKALFSYAHPIFWAPFVLVGDGSGT
ncbi:MAG: CHAT domain-containing protein [Rhodospirillales bacterium]|nr:CHAT domain-containing protein [Rhodospirillales bacterium]